MVIPKPPSVDQQRPTSAPELTVIIPVYASNQQSVDLLRNTLRHLKSSYFQNFQVLVADDASPCGGAVRLASQEFGAELVRLNRRLGPAVARNAAAKKAAADIFVFMDADTTVHPDTLERFAAKFEENPTLDAAIGSYDQRPSASGTVSQFRNLLHCFIHHRASHQASTFWSACGAVRKDWFIALGGFNESWRRPSIEDVEFGLRLRAAGGSINLDPRIQVTHHKAWTFRSMLRTDFLDRAIPWASILTSYPLPVDLNFKIHDRISAGLVAVTMLLTIIAALHGGVWWLSPAISLTTIALLNWPFFRFVAQAAGWWQASLSFPLLLVYLVICVVGLICGLSAAEHFRDLYFGRRPHCSRLCHPSGPDIRVQPKYVDSVGPR